jgi:hypothetical protein
VFVVKEIGLNVKKNKLFCETENLKMWLPFKAKTYG